MLNKDDYIIIAKYLYKYATCKPSIAVKQLLNIDIFRNNYSKSTIYNLLIGARRTLKDGKKNKYFSQVIYHLLLDMKENKISKELNESTMDEQKPVEPPKLSITDMIKEIKKQKEKLKEIYEREKEEKEQLIENIKEEAYKKVEQINLELGILHRAYVKAEVDLDNKEVELTATLLQQKANNE